MSERKKLIILMGVQRSGTTALFNVLASVPGVSACQEAASDSIYDDFYLRPEREIREALHSLPGAVLLKPVRESEVRSPGEVAAEYKDYDLRIIWLYRDPINVFYSYSRLGWADSSLIGAKIFANRWAQRNLGAMVDAPRLEGQILIVCYEDLVAHPNLVNNLCAALWLENPPQNTLRKDSESGRLSLPRSIQALIEKRTAEILRNLKKKRSIYPHASTGSASTSLLRRIVHRLGFQHDHLAAISDDYLPNRGNLQCASLRELLNSDDPGLIYARWRSDDALRRDSGNGAVIVVGYQECKSILSSMRQQLSGQQLSDTKAIAARNDRYQRLEAFLRDRQKNLWQQIQSVLHATCASLLTSVFIDITPTISALAEQIAGIWLGIPQPQAGGLDLLLRRLLQNEEEAWESLRQLIESIGLISELYDRDLLMPCEARAFIESGCLILLALPNLVINTLVALRDHPDVLKRLQNDSELVRIAVQESLRLTPLILSYQHELVEPLRIQEEILPASTTVLLILGAANRDPLIFANPDTFCLDRSSPPPFIFEYNSNRASRTGGLCGNIYQQLVLDLAATVISTVITEYSFFKITCGARMDFYWMPDGMHIQAHNAPRICFERNYNDLI